MWSSTAPFEPSHVFADGYRNHQEPLAAGGVATIDRATWEAVVKANHAAFPDFAVTILSQIAEGDRVATHWRFSAILTGTYEGKPVSSKPLSWTGVQIDRFENGKIAESWVVWDKYTLFEALGLIRP